MTPRYKVIIGSMSQHDCCFVATVVDTHRPCTISEDLVGDKYWEDVFRRFPCEAVCETYSDSEACDIAAALNYLEDGHGG